MLAADACEASGLVVPELDETTAASLRALLPAEASVANPVDMIASATAEDYGQAVRILGTAPELDALIVVYNTPLVTRASDVAHELVAAHPELAEDVALLTVFMNADGPPRAVREAAIAAFDFPENAARALGRSVEWGRRHRGPAGVVQRPEVDVQRAHRLLAEATRDKDGWLATLDAERLLGEYGISVPRSIRARTPGEAEAAQVELGRTVVVKLAAAVHKSDVGGVRLGARTPAAAAGAVLAIRADLEAAGRPGLGDEFLVQEQIESGREMIVGVSRDALLGPLVMVGLGGELVELLGDVTLRLAPLTDDDIEDMLGSLRSYPLLTGYRGAPPLDVGALRQVLQAVSALADDMPEIVEMDLNPVLVLEKGAVAVDVRIRVPARAPSRWPGAAEGTLGRRLPVAPWTPIGSRRPVVGFLWQVPSREGTTMQISAILKTKGQSVATIGQDVTVATAVAELARHNVGALVVSDDGLSVDGIISERDVTCALERFGGAVLDKPIRMIMSGDVRTVTPEEEVESLAVIMTEHRIRHVPVVKDGALVGIVSIGDVVKSRIEELEQDRDALFKYIDAR